MISRSATQRSKDSIAALLKAGGARRVFNLSPEAYKALQYCIKRGSDEHATALINRILIDEKKRIERNGR